MSASRFDDALGVVLGVERGYTVDTGGPTQDGVTQAVYDEWRKRRGLAGRPVSEIAPEEIRAIYREYWDAVRADELPWPVALALFDAAVNMGPAAAVRLLQRSLGVTADGVVGPKTLRAVREREAFRVLEDFLWLRAAHYVELARMVKYRAYLRGWIARLLRVRSAALCSPHA